MSLRIQAKDLQEMLRLAVLPDGNKPFFQNVRMEFDGTHIRMNGRDGANTAALLASYATPTGTEIPSPLGLDVSELQKFADAFKGEESLTISFENGITIKGVKKETVVYPFHEAPPTFGMNPDIRDGILFWEGEPVGISAELDMQDLASVLDDEKRLRKSKDSPTFRIKVGGGKVVVTLGDVSGKENRTRVEIDAKTEGECEMILGTPLIHLAKNLTGTTHIYPNLTQQWVLFENKENRYIVGIVEESN